MQIILARFYRWIYLRAFKLFFKFSNTTSEIHTLINTSAIKTTFRDSIEPVKKEAPESLYFYCKFPKNRAHCPLEENFKILKKPLHKVFSVRTIIFAIFLFLLSFIGKLLNKKVFIRGAQFKILSSIPHPVIWIRIEGGLVLNKH